MLHSKEVVKHDNEEIEEEEILEDPHIASLVRQISSVSFLDVDEQQQRELAKKQYHRLQNWTMAQQHRRGSLHPKARSESTSPVKSSRSQSPEKTSPKGIRKQAMRKIDQHRMQVPKLRGVLLLASQ